jgi:N-acetylglucosaminyldiphosphoundecaprenol N-acetyl-beta-D-mannosaminyltransferase
MAQRPASPAPVERRPRVLGVACDLLSDEDLLSRFESAVESRRRTLVFHVNLHAFFLQRRIPGYRATFGRADVVYADGMPVVALARLSGTPASRRQRSTYLNWEDRFYALAAAKGWRIFYVGSAEPTLRAGLAELRRRHPGLQITGRTGFFDHRAESADTADLVRQMRLNQPDVVLVGMGMPIQEPWAAAVWPRIDAPLMVTLGAGIDYAAGAVPEPPRWMGAVGLEWLYRLLSEPRRLGRRYAVEPLTLVGPAAISVVRERRARNRGSRDVAA